MVAYEHRWFMWIGIILPYVLNDTQHHILKIYFHFMCIGVLPASMYVYYVSVVAEKVRRGCQNYRLTICYVDVGDWMTVLWMSQYFSSFHNIFIDYLEISQHEPGSHSFLSPPRPILQKEKGRERGGGRENGEGREEEEEGKGERE